MTPQKRVAIISCITDGYDWIKPVLPQKGIDAEYIMVTEELNRHAAEQAGWTWREVRNLSGRHPNLAAKHPKTQPWDYTDAPYSVWIDGTFTFKHKYAVADMLMVLGDQEILQFDHPWRNDLFEEAEYSMGFEKYNKLPLMEQAAEYALFVPKGQGLWATGLIVRHHTERIKAFGRLWQAEMEKWGYQDQVSEPYCLTRCGINPATLNEVYYANDRVAYEASGRH